ncbi:hypothetical protein V1512DRAFT_263691 [Lipomyces arxii]|uniref:uncharacterized protein n=1 Tax=Lipomyces arxii TaxID=56418 RepID=UPI0034CEE375
MQHPLFSLLPSVNSTSAAIDFVTRVTAAPDLFTFSYLLHVPSLIQHLQATEQSQSYLKLLKLFASGTWSDYTSNQASLPPLSDQQATKLKQLSLVSLASKSHTLSYSALLSELSLPNNKALSSLVVSCIYSNLITATLDTKAELVTVSAVITGRDVADKDHLLRLKSVIDVWAERCLATVADLNSEAKKVRETALRESKDVQEYNRVVDRINKQLMAPNKDNFSQMPLDDNMTDPMDIDETSPSSDSSTKKRKQRIVS